MKGRLRSVYEPPLDRRHARNTILLELTQMLCPPSPALVAYGRDIVGVWRVRVRVRERGLDLFTGSKGIGLGFWLWCWLG